MLPDSVIRDMYADYSTGMTLSGVGRKYDGRTGETVRGLFKKRGLTLRPSTLSKRRHDRNGRLLPDPEHTPAQIARIIQRMDKIKIPIDLAREWRHWDLKRRSDLIARIRARLQSPNDRPTTPFSSNVEPFDYGSPRAWEIVNRANSGLGSREWKMKIDLCSQGVIYKERLWFWVPKTGYVSGPWSPETGRPMLHQVIWEEHNGRDFPPGHVLRYADGNPNNLTADNLKLVTRNDLARENQYNAITRRSRELTSLLLNRTQQKGHAHDRISLIAGIRRRIRK